MCGPLCILLWEISQLWKVGLRRICWGQRHQRLTISWESSHSCLSINHQNWDIKAVAREREESSTIEIWQELHSLKLCSLFLKHGELDRTFFALPQEFHPSNSGSGATSCSSLPCRKNAAEVENLSPLWSQYPPVPPVSLFLKCLPGI